MNMKRGGGVKKISTLFESYKQRLVAPQKTVIDTFVEVIHDLLSIEIDQKNKTIRKLRLFQFKKFLLIRLGRIRSK